MTCKDQGVAVNDERGDAGWTSGRGAPGVCWPR